MKNFIKNALSENGAISSNRIGFINSVFMIWFLLMLFGSLAVTKIVAVSVTDFTIMISSIGAIFGTIKVAQKKYESGQVKEDINIEKQPEVKPQ